MSKVKEVVAFLHGKPFIVATIENDKPKQRPFGAIAEFENKIYISTAKTRKGETNTRAVYTQIMNNPNISICACGDNRKWVRVDGLLVKDDRQVAKQKMLDDNPILSKHFSSANDSAFEIFYIDNAIIELH